MHKYDYIRFKLINYDFKKLLLSFYHFDLLTNDYDSGGGLQGIYADSSTDAHGVIGNLCFMGFYHH